LIRKGKALLRKFVAVSCPCTPRREAGRKTYRQAGSQARSCEQFLWTNVLARTRARLQALDSARLFACDEKCGTVFCFGNCRDFPGFAQILWTKLCASGLSGAHLVDFAQQTHSASFLSRSKRRAAAGFLTFFVDKIVSKSSPVSEDL
jgi:hypothetical protein